MDPRWEKQSNVWAQVAYYTGLGFILPGGLMAIKEDFIMAEMDNSLRFFTTMFGKYPYSSFSAAFHPFGFGQGFPTLLMIPNANHGYGAASNYMMRRRWDYFVKWLLSVEPPKEYVIGRD